MNQKRPFSKILFHQSLGFLVLISIRFLSEATGLRQLVLGDHPFFARFGGTALEMLLILVIWLLVANSTRRILKHVEYLQGFMRVCAWCRHIHYRGEWIRFEQFLKEGFDTPTTHGICPECLRKEREALARAKSRATAPTLSPEKAPSADT
jgi:hypothetical protein